MNNDNLYNSPDLEELFKDFDPEQAAKVEMRMLLAAKIDDAIKAKGWSKQQFAVKMDKHPSAISKWLSGTHNFESDTLYDIGKMLDISLIDFVSHKSQSQPQPVNHYFIAISSKVDSTKIPSYNPCHPKRSSHSAKQKPSIQNHLC